MKRILIADDERDIRELLVDVLSSKFEVVQAHNGRVALQLAMDSPPDLVLLDITMPEMDGTEVCRKLKAHPATRAVPVIMLTAHGEVTERVRGLNVGADDYMAKPFHPAELVARIEARLRALKNVEESGAQGPLAILDGSSPVTSEIKKASTRAPLRVASRAI